MSSPRQDLETTPSSPVDRLARIVTAGVPERSRRDLLRSAAVLSAVASLSVAPGSIRAAAQTATGHTQSDDDVETGVEITIPFNPFGQLVTLDPHRASNWGPFWVLFPHVWSGLLAFDENGSVVADLAEAVEPNESADVWTARIKPGLKFASGNDINAQSFVDSWRRALDPQRLSPMAPFMELVSGYQDFTSGTSTDIGFEVIDDLTIEISLSEPFSSFPASLATFVWAVVDLAILNDSDLDDPLLAGAGAGLWQFTEFVDGESIAMEPNPNSDIPTSTSIAKIVWAIMDGPDADGTALERYRNDTVVSADIPASLIETVRGNEALSAELVSIESQSSTMAIGMDFNQDPFGDVRVRRAIAASIDRDAWANNIWGGEFVPAVGFVPPVVSITSAYEHADPIAFDADEARSLLDQAGVDPEQNAPGIVYYQAGSDNPLYIDQHAALLAMIEENCGLVVRHDTSLTADQILALQADNGGRQFDIVWWWTVTDTAALLQTAGQSASPFMSGWFNWSPELESVDDQDAGAASSQFDELVSAANLSTETDARNDAFRQAEQLLLDTAVYVPLGHWVQRFVQKPWLLGTRQGAWTGRIPVRFDADVVIQGRPQD